MLVIRAGNRDRDREVGPSRRGCRTAVIQSLARGFHGWGDFGVVSWAGRFPELERLVLRQANRTGQKEHLPGQGRGRFYPRPTVVSGPVSAVEQASVVLLAETIRAPTLDVGLSAGLAR